MRTGVRIGVDVGRRRVGLARSDSSAVLAIPLETLVRGDGDNDWQAVASRIQAIAAEYAAVEIIVGLPLSLSGAHTASTVEALACADAISVSVAPLPVRVIDERLSTVSAQQRLRDAGVGSRSQRNVIDQQAAIVILEHALDMERLSGSPPGRLVSDTTQ